LIHKLEEYYPTRNYNRVIESAPTASDYYPSVVYRLESILRDYINLILEDEASTIRDELRKVEGFIKNIKERKIKISARYRAIADKDVTLKEMNNKLTTEIKPLIDKLESLIIELKKKQAQDKKDKKQQNQKDNNA